MYDPKFVLTKKQMDKLAKITKQVERQPTDLADGLEKKPYNDKPFMGILWSYDSGTNLYTFYHQIVDSSGNLQNYDNLSGSAYTGLAFDLDDRKNLPRYTKVQIWYGGQTATNDPIFYFFPTQTSGLFAVKVKKISGSAGSISTPCTFVYRVWDINDSSSFLGDSYVTPLTPLKRRTSIGPYVAPADGSIGVGFYDETGTFKLWDADEVPDVEACDETE